MIAEVIVDISSDGVDKIFDYYIPEDLTAGYRVQVPFGSRTVEGFVIRTKTTSQYDSSKIKHIVSVLDKQPVILPEQFSLMEFMKEKYHLRYADVLRLFIPSQMRGGKVKELIKQYACISPEYIDKDATNFIKSTASSQLQIYLHLMDVQSEQVSVLNKQFSASALRNLVQRGIVSIQNVEQNRTPYSQIGGSEKPITLTQSQLNAVSAVQNAKSGECFLLFGVTGSGKTEVYMNCISSVLQKGKTAIMLVPEIALTPQVLRNFRSRFNNNVALLHSGLSAGERFDEWRRILCGEARVVVGARSAIFAPMSNVGLIVIDEEHDSSYISESNPRYATIDIARFRCEYNKCNIILGSATPSVESYYKAQCGQYTLINMPLRINSRQLPKIEVIDMKKELYNGNNSIFSTQLESQLRQCINNGNQAMIFINRRGYSSYLLCRSCGYVAKCVQCDASLVYHKEDNVLKCHYCGNRYSSLDLCPECKSVHIKRGYVGTQQVAEALKKMFPDKKILRMDNDTTQSKDAHAQILGEFAQKKASILVGTQMIAKGHDFPDVTLVGIVDADLSLYISDYRACERTFQLITQVSGRAGRDTKAGTVILQSFTPHHYVYKYAIANDYLAFYNKESNFRQTAKYPPFSTIVRVLISGEDEAATAAVLKNIYNEITLVQKQQTQSFAYLATMRSPVKRIQNKFRMQILMRIVDNEQQIIQSVYESIDKNERRGVSCFAEINPTILS